MRKILAILLIISILSLAGCTLMMPIEEAAPETAQSVVDEIESGIDDIGTLEQDLDISELDDLEKELEEIDW